MNAAASLYVGSPTGATRSDDLQCVLDLVHLSRHTLGDRALETELLELFDRQAAGALARLTDIASTRNAAGADIAHMLKGSARAVGAFAVANAADVVEASLRAGMSGREAIGELSSAVERARSTIASLLR